MSQYDDGLERTFIFVFCDAQRHAWTRFLKTGYTHVYLLEQTPAAWLIYNPTRYGLDLYAPDCEADVALLERLVSNGEKISKAVQVTVNKYSGRLLWPPQPLSCVTMVGYLSGIRFGWRELTPYRLYKRLVAGKIKGLANVRELETCQVDAKTQKERDELQTQSAYD